MASAAVVGFTSCSDDDDDAPVVVTPDDLTLSQDIARVKIGPENRVLLPVATGAGEYHAYSLNPDIADVVTGDDGMYYIEGFKNGTADLVVSDAANRYVRMKASVYTTEEMTLSHTAYNFKTPMGLSSSSSECHVVLGNGGYTVESDNSKVVATIDAETGVITMTATSAKNEFTAKVTVTDCSGLSASMDVTVVATFDPFTDADLQNLMAATSNDWYIKSSQFSQTRCSDLPYYENYGEWTDEANGDGTHTFGWWEIYWGSDYGGHHIVYPEGTAVGEEVAGKYLFKYNIDYGGGNYPKYELEGTVKILKDDDVSKVVIWWNVDMENECINRGWIVKKK